MRDTVIPETYKVTRERSNRQVRYIERLLRNFLKDFLNRSREYSDSLPSIIRMGGDNILLLFCYILYGLLNFQRINFFRFFLRGLNEGKGIGQ